MTKFSRGFHDHHGYDGVFLAVPGTGAHLELTAGGGHGLRRRTRRCCWCWPNLSPGGDA